MGARVRSAAGSPYAVDDGGSAGGVRTAGKPGAAGDRSAVQDGCGELPEPGDRVGSDGTAGGRRGGVVGGASVWRGGTGAEPGGRCASGDAGAGACSSAGGAAGGAVGGGRIVVAAVAGGSAACSG